MDRLRSSFQFVILSLLITVAIASPSAAEDTAAIQVTDGTRLITIGGSITETVYALGGGDHVVGVDASSSYPPPVHQLPKVPYIRNLNSEGVLSLEPDVIVTNEDARPRSVLEQLRTAGVRIAVLPDHTTPEGAYSMIRRIGRLLGETEAAEQIVNRNKKQLERAKNEREELEDRPSVLFLLSAGSGQNSIMAAGSGTAAHAMIRLAGGSNLLTDMSGYKPVNPEVIASANPEFILMIERGEHGPDSTEPLEELPGIGLTRAVQQDNVITMNGNYLLGFGPRTGQAVLDLMSKLHDQVDREP